MIIIMIIVALKSAIQAVLQYERSSHVQHVACHVVRRDSSAIKADRV